MFHYIHQLGIMVLLRVILGIPIKYLLVVLGLGVYFYYNPDQWETLKNHVLTFWEEIK